MNSLVAHKKISLLDAYNSVYRYDIICISESFLDSTISDDNNIFHIEGYNLIRADHLDNIERGSVCLYIKKSLDLKKIQLSHITQCLLCEVNIKRQVGFIIVSYRPPSQASPLFDDFLSNFEKLFDEVQIFQPAFTVILGDFNALSKSWWSGDSATTEGTRLNLWFLLMVFISWFLNQLIYFKIRSLDDRKIKRKNKVETQSF